MTTQDAMMFFSMMVMVLASTTVFYVMQRMTIGAFAALGWFFWGAYTYRLAGGIGDFYTLMGTFFIFIGMFVSWEVWTDLRTERKAEAEEERAEDLDDLQDRYEDALSNFDDKEANGLKRQINELKARGNPTINISNRRDQFVKTRQNRKVKIFNKEGRL